MFVNSSNICCMEIIVQFIFKLLFKCLVCQNWLIEFCVLIIMKNKQSCIINMILFITAFNKILFSYKISFLKLTIYI